MQGHRNNGTHLLVQESGQTLGSSTDDPNISGGRLIIEHEHVDGGRYHTTRDFTFTHKQIS